MSRVEKMADDSGETAARSLRLRIVQHYPLLRHLLCLHKKRKKRGSSDPANHHHQLPTQETPITDKYDYATARAEIFGPEVPDLHHTLWERLSRSASAYPDKEAVVSLWQPSAEWHLTRPLSDDHGTRASEPSAAQCLRWTYHDLLARVESLAASLKRLGCGPNMQLAAVLWNSAEWALFFWAAARLEMTFVPVDPRVPGDVRAMLSSLSLLQVVVVQDAEGAVAGNIWREDDILPKGSNVLRIQCSGRTLDGWTSLSKLLSVIPDTVSAVYVNDDKVRRPKPDTRLAAAAAALIVFTSGTTGKPKGCVHTERNILSQLCEYDPNPDPRVVDRWLVHTPVSHIFAVNNALRAWMEGYAVAFASKAFDVASTIRALTEERCTIMSATPTLVKALMAHPSFPRPEDLHLSLVTVAGTSIDRDDIDLCKKGLGTKDAIQAFGMSEGAPLISWSRQDPMLRNGYHVGVGKALPGTAVRICQPDSREIVGINEVGELHISGSSVISSYLDSISCDSFYDDDRGRWFMTGDQAKVDDEGVIYILGRYKDLIIRGGENLLPQKLEAALQQIEGVEAHVVGVPDEIAGQVPVAVVRMPQEISKAEIAKHASSLGPRYCLEAVYTLQELGLDSIPKTSLGKVKKVMLKNIVLEHRATLMASTLTYDDTVSTIVNSEGLLERLATLWEKLTGVRPLPHEKLVYSADSITLLRYCDSVWRTLGKRLYLQDLVRNDTLDKQAQLLENLDLPRQSAESRISDDDVREGGRTSFGTGSTTDDSYSIPPKGRFTRERQSWTPDDNAIHLDPEDHKVLVARRKLGELGLGTSKIENILSIRDSLHRTAVGQRPQSYHVRIVFRVRSAQADQIRAGLEKALSLRPTLRTVLCLSNQGEPFHAVVEADKLFLDQVIIARGVNTLEDAQAVIQDESTGTHKSVFMFKAEIISIRDTGHSILSLTYNHSTVDALTLLYWHQDLDRLIHNVNAINAMRTPYHLFSDLLVQYQDSQLGQQAVAFHVQRLRGISRLKGALFPKQRAPGWMISNDAGSEHAESRHNIRQEVWNGQWGRRKQEFRYPRLGRVVCLPQLKELRERHGIRPDLFAKCAISLFNVLKTRSSHAVFNSWESGRSWPFVPDWMERMLPPAMGIDGPTAQWILNIIEVIDSETITQLLQRSMAEQEMIQRHQHAPWNKVVSELREEGPVAVDASFRQSFVWDASIGLAASQGFKDDLQELEPMARYDWADCGLFWNAFMVDSDNLYFVASWDTAQMNADEVESHCDALAEVMRKLADEKNGNRTVGEVFGR